MNQTLLGRSLLANDEDCENAEGMTKTQEVDHREDCHGSP